MYGLVVGGIRGARIWFGPLPSEICYVQVWATNVIVWYSVLTIFFISWYSKSLGPRSCEVTAPPGLAGKRQLPLPDLDRMH